MLLQKLIRYVSSGSMIGCILPLVLFCQGTSHPVKYDGHQVLKISPKSLQEERRVFNLVRKYGLDIWHIHHHEKSLDVQIYPDIIEFVTQELSNLKVSYSTMIPNVQRLIDQEANYTERHIFRRATSKQSLSHSKYYNFSEIEELLEEQDLSDGIGPSGELIFSQNSVIGRTYEGRKIHLIKIFKSGSTPKKAIFVDGGIHAREWISSAFLLYLMNQLKYNPDSSTEIESLVDDYDWYLVPVLNPDGYSFSHEHDRLWRKNRRINRDSPCHGVDINRNFGYEWNPAIGGSTNPCAQIYAGIKAFSEPESQAMRNFFTLNKNIDFLSYLTIHSYGQMWLYPWGYTSEVPEDVIDLDVAAGVAIEGLYRRYNTKYMKGSSTNVLYSAAGGSDDYAKGEVKIKYSYTLELRDTGRYGFVLPEHLIIPTCQETLDAIIAFSKKLQQTLNIATD